MAQWQRKDAPGTAQRHDPRERSGRGASNDVLLGGTAVVIAVIVVSFIFVGQREGAGIGRNESVGGTAGEDAAATAPAGAADGTALCRAASPFQTATIGLFAVSAPHRGFGDLLLSTPTERGA